MHNMCQGKNFFPQLNAGKRFDVEDRSFGAIIPVLQMDKILIDEIN